jgi:hypothetical protein
VLGGDFFVEQRNDDLSRDTSFNAASTPGWNRINVAESVFDSATSVALQPDGKIVLTGYAATGAGGFTYSLAAARVNPDGTLDASFNAAGPKPGTAVYPVDIRPVFSYADAFRRAVLDANGRIVVPAPTGSDSGVARIIGTVEKGARLAVGGSENATASVFVPNGLSGAYVTPASATTSPFGGLGVNVRTAVADVDGDRVPDTVLVTGPGTPIRVAVVSGRDNTTLLVAPFDPFGGDFTGGGFVTAADFDHDGRSELVVTPDRGGGPRISVFSWAGGSAATLRANFLTIEPDFRGGVRPGAGDINGDGTPDLAISAGFLGGPRIALIDGTKLFSIAGPLAAPSDKLTPIDFFAFSPELRDGAFVSVGDVNGDGFADLVFGSGDGGGPNVRVVSGQQVMTAGGDAAALNPLASFFSAGSVDSRGGVRVAVVDADGDHRADVVTGSGKGQPAKARLYLGGTVSGTAEPAGFQELDPYAGIALTDGVHVG